MKQTNLICLFKMSSVNEVHFLAGQLWNKQIALTLARYIVELAVEGCGVNVHITKNLIDIVDVDPTHHLSDKNCHYDLLTTRIKRHLLNNIHYPECSIISSVENDNLYLHFYQRETIKV